MKKTIGFISANYTNAAFGELTARRTLASLPYAGRYRLIDFILSNMVNSGITTVGLVTPHAARSLLDHVGVGKPWDLGRKRGGLFILPGSAYGMRAGSGKMLLRDVAQNLRFLKWEEADYVLICGSSKIYNMDYRPLIKAHEKSGKEVTFLYANVENAKPGAGLYLETDADGCLTCAKVGGEGAGKRFMDCMVINRNFLLKCVEWYSALEFMSLTEILVQNLKDISVGTYAFDGYLGSADSISDFMQMNLDVLDRDICKELFESERHIATRIQDCPPTHYKPGSSVKDSFVSAGCLIEGEVEHSVIAREVVIKPGAVVKNCVIMAGCVIEENARLENVICDKNAVIHKGVQMIGGAEPLVIAKDRTL